MNLVVLRLKRELIMAEYNPSIPQPRDLLSNSQGDLLNNFTAFSDAVANDHIAINAATPAERIKHKYCHLKIIDVDAEPPQTVPTTNATEGAVYVKSVDIVSGLKTVRAATRKQEDLYFRHKSNGTEVKISSGGGSGGTIWAWALLNLNGGLPVIITASRNIATAVWVSIGSELDITFTNPTANTTYFVTSSTDSIASGPHYYSVAGIYNVTVNGFRLKVGNSNNYRIAVIV